MILPGVTLGQNFTLPSLAADSAYFEIVLGRKCTKVVTALDSQVVKLTTANLAQGEVINIQNTVIEAQAAEIKGWPKELAAKGDLWAVEKQGLKTKANRLRAWLVGLVGFDVAIVILVLLVL